MSILSILRSFVLRPCDVIKCFWLWIIRGMQGHQPCYALPSNLVLPPCTFCTQFDRNFKSDCTYMQRLRRDCFGERERGYLMSLFVGWDCWYLRLYDYIFGWLNACEWPTILWFRTTIGIYFCSFCEFFTQISISKILELVQLVFYLIIMI